MTDNGNIPSLARRVSAGNGSGNGHQNRAARFKADDFTVHILTCLKTSLKQQWENYRKSLKASRKKLSEKAIHETRVSARRLLSTLELLASFLPAKRTEKIEKLLKHHLDIFDDLRDTQVQLPIVRKLKQEFAAAGPFYGCLQKKEARLARDIRGSVKKAKTKRLGRLIRVCSGRLKEQRQALDCDAAITQVLNSIDRAFERTAELRVRVDPADTGTIHRTRVAFKRFRYMVEALGGYLPPAHTKDLLADMRRYQGMMGDVQDSEVLLASFRRFAEKKELSSAGAQQLCKELIARRQQLIQKYLAHADELLTFWHAGTSSPIPQAE